ncbi:methylamine methyltransferase corrinoid protein reductive activase [Methanolobus sp. ZRKC3]|uniref:methylamine methyltransferase corrinoid protein reductive activase n=1 Tax=Methanolobus sp. ZRKC3 TaxID=3125786 RepID=UPI003249F59D
MYGIAIDLGTSGFRLQLLDLETKNVIKTVMTMRHPLPGGNVTDHLHFAIHVGQDVTHQIMMLTIKKMLNRLNIPLEQIQKMVACGNPIQLSLFQNIEIRDLAYAGKNMQKRLGVENIERGMKVYNGSDIFNNMPEMQNCEIIVLPSIQHEIGADALAMMIKTDFMDETEISLVTDYGTNAEMALKVGDRIITASAAAGPAIEGQGIKCGMLASPGAISDVNEEDGLWRITVLDEMMQEKKGHLIDPVTGKVSKEGEIEPKGITGTGVISAISLAISTGLVEKLPELPNGKLVLGEDIEISDKDIAEAGKAIGAIRAAHLTLLVESGLKYSQLVNMYMSGASGTYVDANKARVIGLCPGFSKKIVQFGNTSLALAKDVIFGKYALDEISKLAHKIKADHLMMATNDTFKDIYTCELAYWTEGMSIETYNEFLEAYDLPRLPEIEPSPIMERRATKDIEDTGAEEIDVINDMNIVIEEETKGCLECKICEAECPEDALMIVQKNGIMCAEYTAHLCLGMSCKRCVRICPSKAITYRNIKTISH